MACSFVAKNGEKSILYDKLANVSQGTAIKNFAYTKTDSFANWFGNGKLDANGEPDLDVNGEFTNEAGETKGYLKDESVHSEMGEITMEDFNSQIESLTSMFEEAGLDIEVSFNADMGALGSVITVNGKTSIEFNPRQVKKDTVWHEFGHILVDMYGDRHVIERGIEHLKDTALAKQLKKMYPHLTDEQFGKELLTTAIGIEAARLHDYRARLYVESGKDIIGKVRAWQFWFEHFLKSLAEKLGIGITPVKRLAFELTGGKLKHRLTGKPANYKQFQVTGDKMSINDLKLDSKRLTIAPDEAAYLVDNDPSLRMGRVTNVIENLKGVFDKKAAIEGFKAKQEAQGNFYSDEQIEELWADKREEGTGIHLMAETYIKAINSGMTKAQAREAVLNNLYVPDKVGEPDSTGVRFYGGMDRALVEDYVDNITQFLDSLYDKGYKLHSEIKIFDEEMGIAGTIDLLIELPNGDVMIYDWKTKESGKFNYFYTKDKYNKAYADDMLEGVPPSKANDYALQLSTYKLMLERKGFKVVKMAIIPVVGTPITEDTGETRYHNVEIAQTKDTDEDGVLPLDDLSDKLKTVYLGKDNVDETLDEIAATEETIETLSDQVSELHKTNEWIQEVILNLNKSISRMKATANVDDAIRFERIVKNVMKELLEADETKAIINYTRFITSGLQGIYTQMSHRTISVPDENGAMVTKFIKGYDSYTWQDIKLLEETDKPQYMEFLAFLINADMFLSQVVKIRQLPSSDAKQVNEVHKALKVNEGIMSDLQLKIGRLNKELDMRYVELSSNPLYGGRGVLDNTQAFFKAQMDESFMQRNMDAMADTHNSFMANVIKMYDYKMREYKDEVIDETKRWDEAVKILEASGSNVMRFVDEESGKVIPRLDYSAYYEARAKMFSENKEKFKTNKKGFAKTVNAWLLANTEILTKEEIAQLEADKKLQLGEIGFKEWRAKQLYTNTKGTTTYSRTGAYYKPALNKWMNSRYVTFTNAEKDFHTYLLNTLAFLTEHTKESVVKHGYLPSVPVNNTGVLAQIAKNIGWRDAGQYDNEQGVIVNEAGDIVQFLPFKYNNLLNQKQYEKVLSTDSEEVKAQKRRTNEEIRINNKKAHAAEVNMDLKATMKLYMNEALKHKHKKAIEFEMLRVRKSFIENHKISVTKNGVPVVDKFKKMAGFVNNEVEKSTLGSNVLAHYEDWLKMVFYEEFEADEGAWQKVARVLQNYTSFKGMALNPLSAMNNQVYGTLMNHIESVSGQFFSTGDWAKATAEYGLGVISFMADREGQASTKQSAFLQYFNITMDFTEAAFGNENTSIAQRAMRGLNFAVSKAYMLEHISEHNIQNRTLMAMAYSHKVVDGVIMSFDEFKRGKLKEISYKSDKELTKAALSENKGLMKELKEQWKTHTSVYEAFEFKDGKMSPKEGIVFKKDEIAEFERRVLGVNQYLHGIYNKADAGAMQQYALGRLAIQFRKWMRPGWNKRFGTRFGAKFWNERRSMEDEGIYFTTLNFIGRPIIDSISDFRDKAGTAEAIGVMKAIGNIVRGYGDMLTRSKVHWETLSDTQKANVIRTVLEYLAFCSAIGLLYALKYVKGDDEEPPLALMLAIYQADRTATELTTYVPLAAAPGYVGGGWLNESKKILKSPTATFNTLESAIKIGQQLILYPFSNEEDLIYKSGVYHGQNKLQTEMLKAIPIYNQTVRWNNLYENYNHYKLF
jgi:hypothetical protein